MIIEACVDTLARAQAAQGGGANQIELCAQLDLDGLTPDLTLAKAALEALRIPVKVMIRPRAGDFIFTEEEVQQMLTAIAAFQAIGVQRFVIGLATPDQQLDLPNIKRICAAFPIAEFTLHKVIDTVHRPLVFIPQLNRIPNLKSILSSGGATTALQGAVQLLALQQALGPSKQVIAAGKITAANLSEVQAKVPIGAYHGRHIIDWPATDDQLG